MKRFDQWTLEVIRTDKSMMQWLEERRYEWIPLVVDAIRRILAGYTILLLVDDERRWYGEYVLSTINRPAQGRPFIPIYDLRRLAPYLEEIKGNEEIALLFETLHISFQERFFIWYVGRAISPFVNVAKGREDSFLWILDENMQNNFTLKSQDEMLDIKLIQLFRLFERSLDGAIFGEVEL
ncbi:MAG: hypothetical protein C6I00_03935 [Nitratiruptor sp.]|nr:hypothetical protein [Nitratiruptor sp.]NPA83933.1 hypothetical protein [Campylobacterota bacterium]